MICGVNFRDEIMRMDRNHAPGPVVDLSAIAATFPGENITQAFKIFSYSFCVTFFLAHSYVHSDLTSEERQLLLDIRRRKAELLQVGP